MHNSSQKVSNVRASHSELLENSCDRDGLQQLLRDYKASEPGPQNNHDPIFQASLMNIRNTFGTNEYNDDDDWPEDDLNERDPNLEEFEKKSRSRSRQQ